MAYTWPPLQLNSRFLTTLIVDFDGELFMNTLWHACSQFTGTPSIEVCMDNMDVYNGTAGRLYSRYLDLLPPNMTLQEVWIQQIDPIRYVKKVYSKTDAGLWSVDAQTGNVAATIERRGVVASRKAISTFHMPIAQNSGALANGKLTGAMVSACNLLAAELADPLTLGGASAITMNPVIRNGPGTTDFQVIQLAFVQDTARVMRRRTVRVGI